MNYPAPSYAAADEPPAGINARRKGVLICVIMTILVLGAIGIALGVGLGVGLSNNDGDSGGGGTADFQSLPSF